MSGPRVSSTSPALPERRHRMKSDRAAARVERRQRARRTADRLRAALKRSHRFLAERAVDHQKRDLAPIRPARSSTSHPASIAARASCTASAPPPAITTSPSPPPGCGRVRIGGTVGVVRVVVVAAARLATVTPGGDVARGDRRRPPARLAEALLVERARDVEAGVDPTRSISSNGPIRKPPPSRQMRSISSSGAISSWSSLSASSPNGLLQRLTRKPGPSVASITCLPIASPAARATRKRRLGGLLAGDHLEQSHHRRRVEEVHPDHSFRPLEPSCDCGDEQRRGVGREHAIGRTRRRRRACRTASA